MKFRLLSCILFLIVIIPLVAQETGNNQIENDYRNFRETFDQEFTGIDSSLSTKEIALHPVQLPNWLAEIPDSTENCVYAIGISDPGMSFEEAIDLATLRAKVILALLYKPEISSITDNYSNELTKSSVDKFFTKYVNYYQVFAALPFHQNDFQLVEQSFNSFNEAIVLLKYTPNLHANTQTDSLMLKVDIYLAERQQSNRFEIEEKYEVYGLSKENNNENDVDIFYYFFKSVNQFYEIISRYNGRELDFPQNLFRYQSLHKTVSTHEESSISYKLTNGLWKAYLQSLIQNYTEPSENPDMNVAQLGDHYSSKTQNLSRELVLASPNFRLSGLHISNNRLSVRLRRVDFNH